MRDLARIAHEQTKVQDVTMTNMSILLSTVAHRWISLSCICILHTRRSDSTIPVKVSRCCLLDAMMWLLLLPMKLHRGIDRSLFCPDRETNEGVLKASNDVEVSQIVGENRNLQRKKADPQLSLRELGVVSEVERETWLEEVRQIKGSRYSEWRVTFARSIFRPCREYETGVLLAGSSFISLSCVAKFTAYSNNHSCKVTSIFRLLKNCCCIYQ